MHGFTSGFNSTFGVAAGDAKGTLVFNADNSFTLDSITVFVNNYYCGAGTMNTVAIEILDPTGAQLTGSPVTYSATCTSTGNGDNALKMKVPIGLYIPQGNGYKMRLGSTSPNTIVGFLNGTNGGQLPSPLRYNYPTSYNDVYGDPVVTFQANDASFNLYYNPTAFPGYFDWKITKGINCKRVPVRALYACPLPLNFLDLKITYSTLTFSTLNKNSCEKYLIQQSYNGIDFNTIGEILPNQHNSNNEYEYILSASDAKKVYYRVAELNKNGSLYYSNSIKRIETSTDNLISIYPNPSNETTELNFENVSDFKTVNVYNIGGYKIEQHELNNNSNKLVIGNNYEKGIYIIEIVGDESIEKFKFIKN